MYLSARDDAKQVLLKLNEKVRPLFDDSPEEEIVALLRCRSSAPDRHGYLRPVFRCTQPLPSAKGWM